MGQPAAIVLAGGLARRMGGADKLAFPVAGATVLDRVLGAARAASDAVVVVGRARPTTVSHVLFVPDDAPGGGPVPAVKTGLAHVPGADLVFLLAGDLPLLTADALGQLMHELLANPDWEAAAADDGHRPNALLALYRAPVLHRTASGLGRGDAARRLLPRAAGLVHLPPHATLNVNTSEDLQRAADLLGAREGDQRGQ